MFLSSRAEALDLAHTYENPTWHHVLGTDGSGRDVMLRVLVATRLSLELGLAAAAIAIGIGTVLGGFVPLAAGPVRQVIQRWIDGMLAFPALLTAVLIGAIFGIGVHTAVIGVGIAVAFPIARLTSTLALSVGGREYVQTARVIGVRGHRLIRRYLLPNIAEPLLVAASITVSSCIIFISALSFLGLGVRSPSVDWGSMLTDGVKSVYLTPGAATGPAAAIALTSLAFGFFGEAVARAMNPLLWTSPGSALKRRARRASRREPVSAATEITEFDALEEGETSAVRVRDLRVGYETAGGRVEIVKGVSFGIQAGETLGLVGESGSGKTITALAVAQLVPHPLDSTGSILVDGQDVRTLPRKKLDTLLGLGLAVVFQDPASAFNPALRIGRQIEQPIRAHRAGNRHEARTRALSALRGVHLPAPERLLHRYPHELSGGMRQRVMIAKALMKDPVLLIADEPTTALDVTVQAQIMGLLSEIKEQHQTAILLISHNLALVSQTCDRIAVMYAGRVVEEFRASDLGDARHPYTVGLLGAIPEIGDARFAGHANIPGEVPDVVDPPSGCAYHPRCPLAGERCRVEVPTLLHTPGRSGRVACHVANGEDVGASIRLSKTVPVPSQRPPSSL
jgi:oligopeptide/dipeptide ABC transporter ATP-binding protein